jgi:hypothetical protein
MLRSDSVQELFEGYHFEGDGLTDADGSTQSPYGPYEEVTCN